MLNNYENVYDGYDYPIQEDDRTFTVDPETGRLNYLELLPPSPLNLDYIYQAPLTEEFSYTQPRSRYAVNSEDTPEGRLYYIIDNNGEKQYVVPSGPDLGDESLLSYLFVNDPNKRIIPYSDNPYLLTEGNEPTTWDNMLSYSNKYYNHPFLGSLARWNAGMENGTNPFDSPIVKGMIAATPVGMTVLSGADAAKNLLNEDYSGAAIDVGIGSTPFLGSIMGGIRGSGLLGKSKKLDELIERYNKIVREIDDAHVQHSQLNLSFENLYAKNSSLNKEREKILNKIKKTIGEDGNVTEEISSRLATTKIPTINSNNQVGYESVSGRKALGLPELAATDTSAVENAANDATEAAETVFKLPELNAEWNEELYIQDLNRHVGTKSDANKKAFDITNKHIDEIAELKGNMQMDLAKKKELLDLMNLLSPDNIEAISNLENEISNLEKNIASSDSRIDNLTKAQENYTKYFDLNNIDANEIRRIFDTDLKDLSKSKLSAKLADSNDPRENLYKYIMDMHDRYMASIIQKGPTRTDAFYNDNEFFDTFRRYIRDIAKEKFNLGALEKGIDKSIVALYLKWLSKLKGVANSRSYKALKLYLEKSGKKINSEELSMRDVLDPKRSTSAIGENKLKLREVFNAQRRADKLDQNIKASQEFRDDKSGLGILYHDVLPTAVGSAIGLGSSAYYDEDENFDYTELLGALGGGMLGHGAWSNKGFARGFKNFPLFRMNHLPPVYTKYGSWIRQHNPMPNFGRDKIKAYNRNEYGNGLWNGVLRNPIMSTIGGAGGAGLGAEIYSSFPDNDYYDNPYLEYFDERGIPTGEYMPLDEYSKERRPGMNK